jgi:dTDP-4-amino-4,6-dideoxygalactose transaminase
MPPLEEYVEEIRPLFETRLLTNQGVLHERLAAQLAEFLGVPHVTLYTNGHLAIEAALEALQLSGEVITTPFTFASTTHAIVRRGLTPVFCDIKPDDYTLDPTLIEALITDKTTAILPVHVYGTPCDTAAIDAIARAHGLKVLYDAAHAFGVKAGGTGIGAFGDASVFSFHATKVFNTLEGGCVTFRDDALVQPLDLIKNFGITGPEAVVQVGGNAKLDEFRSAMGLCNLRHNAEAVARRREVFEGYNELLSGLPGVKTLTITPGVTPNYAYYPLYVDPSRFGADRDQVFAALRQADIFPRKYFYPLTSAFDCYQGVLDPGHTPVAEDVADRILTLPIHTGIPDSEVKRIGLLIRSLAG